MLFLSPRNNLEGHLNVLDGADCQIFLRARGTHVEHILSKREMRASIVPELNDLLDDTPVDIYPYTKTFEEARMDPCLVLHTTGSTGLPKPIVWKLGILSTYEAWRTTPSVNGYVPTTEIYQQSKRAYTSMPLFHTSGINACITWSLLLGVTLVFGAPHVLPNARYTDEMHRYAGVDASMGAPSIYEELSRDADSLERINNFHYVVASGGKQALFLPRSKLLLRLHIAPLSQQAGALISKHTRIICNLGATETACLQRLAPAIDDWPYFYWHPTHSGIEMREYMDGMYELFIVRDSKLELYQGVFYTFPEIQEWSMNDLYERHPDPSKRFLYRYKGRKDDVIVLNNGEKIAPALMETTLMSHKLVKGAMVVGRGEFQPAVLVDLDTEPPQSAPKRRQLVESLLPVISEANEHAPAHGKLDQHHLLFADPKKQIHYLGQGKIQRYLTYKVYEQDIEKLYRDADDASEQFGPSSLPRLDFESEESIMRWLKQLIADVTDVRELDMDQDLFEAGIDSLQVTRMARELKFQSKKAGLREYCANQVFSSTAIYQNPKLGQLSAFIFHQAHVEPLTNGQKNGRLNSRIDNRADGRASYQVRNHHLQPSSYQELQTLLDTYASDLPPSARISPPPSTERMVVILSGSTGSLGSYLLEALYHNKNVDRIICLNRSSNAIDKHKCTGLKRGLTNRFDSNRVEFLQTTFSQPLLGLEAEVYKRMLDTVTHIIREFFWPTSSCNWALD